MQRPKLKRESVQSTSPQFKTHDGVHILSFFCWGGGDAFLLHRLGTVSRPSSQKIIQANSPNHSEHRLSGIQD